LGNAHLWGAYCILFVASQPLVHPLQ